MPSHGFWPLRRFACLATPTGTASAALSRSPHSWGPLDPSSPPGMDAGMARLYRVCPHAQPLLHATHSAHTVSACADWDGSPRVPAPRMTGPIDLSEMGWRDRCQLADVEYLPPGMHPKDGDGKEVHSTVYATRQKWRRSREKQLRTRCQRAETERNANVRACRLGAAPLLACAKRCAP